jgi:tRNA(fMet)-specific endonuclease VapC
LARIRPLNKSLLDTDIFSDITKGVNPTVAGHATAYRKTFSRYTISAVTFMEVIRGYQKKQATRQLQNLLTAIASEEVIPFD